MVSGRLVPDQWEVSEFTFRAPQADAAARLEITFEGPVEGLASVDEQTGKLVVTLVNGSPDAPAEVDLRVQTPDRVSLRKGVLLTSDSFLPASVFEPRALEVGEFEQNTATLQIPQHSVAQQVFNQPHSGSLT